MTVMGNEKIDISFEEKSQRSINTGYLRFHKTTLKLSNL